LAKRGLTAGKDLANEKQKRWRAAGRVIQFAPYEPIPFPTSEPAMKTLFLMRHAKSSWDDKIADDRDRLLSKRGKKNAERMGELLKHEKLIPGLILASSAARASQTAEILMDELKYKGDVCFLNRLYMAEMDAYIEEIQGISDTTDMVLVIGHSPTLDYLLQTLTGVVETVPTAALAQLAVPVDSWAEFQADTRAELVQFWRPKELEK
jgi:phosphohistidine phosphatase